MCSIESIPIESVTEVFVCHDGEGWGSSSLSPACLCGARVPCDHHSALVISVDSAMPTQKKDNRPSLAARIHTEKAVVDMGSESSDLECQC